MSNDRFDKGMKVRREVLGDAHVDRAQAGKTSFDEAFQRYITEAAWGAVWDRPNLDRRTRSLITIALLGALGCREELKMHVRAARNTGATAEEVAEALLHVAVYAGVPAANRSFAAAGEVYAEPEPSAPGDDPQ